MQTAKKRNPSVTVIVGCYNHARFVERCLYSVLEQTYPEIEVVIFDDASSDESLSVIRRWMEANALSWKVLSNERNVGVCANLNRAISIASGKYVAFVSADDEWEDEKTSQQVAMLESAPLEVGMVYSDARVIGEDGALLAESFIEYHGGVVNGMGGDVLLALWRNDFIPAMTTLVRRECFRVVGGYDEQLCYEDWDMWLRIARQYKIMFSSYKSARYRIVGTSMMRTREAQIRESAVTMLLKNLRPELLPQGQREEGIDILTRTAMWFCESNIRGSWRLIIRAFRWSLQPCLLRVAVRQIMRQIFKSTSRV